MKNLWNNNLIQFARFIEEAQATGAFTKKVIKDMATSMDLEVRDIHEIMERARIAFEKQKAKLP